jgi:hypothetical protein
MLLLVMPRTLWGVPGFPECGCRYASEENIEGSGQRPMLGALSMG